MLLKGYPRADILEKNEFPLDHGWL